MEDLSALQNELTIASNGIFLAYASSPFRPTFYTVEDSLVAQDRGVEIHDMEGSIKIIPGDLHHHIGPSDDTTFILFRREYSGFPRFSMDMRRGAYFGGTVTYLNLQLAYHLGCREAYLIGMDHSYAVPSDLKSDVIVSESSDTNHFHPDYFGPGYRYHDPKLLRMEEAYKRAKRAWDEGGRRILNATRGGNLEVFERASLDDVLSGTRSHE